MAKHILRIPIALSETPTPMPIFLAVLLFVIEDADVRVVEGEDKVGEVGGGEMEGEDKVGEVGEDEMEEVIELKDAVPLDMQRSDW
jgi:hypothetical protein